MAITIDKAILLSQYILDNKLLITNEYNEAIKLGIKAMEREILYRHSGKPFALDLLDGESYV